MFKTLLFLLLVVLSFPVAGFVVLPVPRELSETITGELLLGELGCVKCHQTDDNTMARLRPRQSPRLGLGGLALTPQYLRDLLSGPAMEKIGGTMPDVMHALSPAEKPEAVEALVHFLLSFQSQAPGAADAADEFLIARGRQLYHQVGCVACHAPAEPASQVASRRAGSLETSPGGAPAVGDAIPLGRLARKTTVGELARYLLDPLTVRPSGRCPSLSLSKGEARALSMYLLRDQAGLGDPQRAPTRVGGLQYQYYEQAFSRATEMENAKVAETGSVPQFDLSPRKRAENVGLRFSGYVRVPVSGEYTFYTASDDGTLLYIDGRLVVENDGHHGTTERSGTIRLTEGEHPVLLAWFNAGGPAELAVFYSGPGLSKQEIPASALTHLAQPMVPLNGEALTPDPAKVRSGKDYFLSLGCAVCHELSGERIRSDFLAPPLAALAGRGASGCLSADPSPRAPRYSLAPSQRAALSRVLARTDRFAQPQSAQERIRHIMAQLNCYACHRRDDVGGPESVRSDYFTTAFEADMGDEGRLPPHLTGVGAKLKADWFKEVLLNAGRARPYMATRMPQFGPEQVGQLPALFAKADYVGKTVEEALRRADAKHGRRLVGTTGLSCITCHVFSGHASLGIPAMDLTYMPGRLQYSWFKEYMLDPAGLRPGTRMPSFWPDGKSVNGEVLGGDAGDQIAAIWGYLSLAKDTGLPPGLIQGQMELVVTNEAVIYRHWIAGAGPRTIAVGYPERANLAFDAEHLRLALIWQGPFIDAAKHRSGRGAGFEGPLGYNVVQMSAGPSFALLDNSQAPWPAETPAELDPRLLGYRLDEKRRPVFRYRFSEIQIEDHFVDMPGELDGNFKRTLKLRADHPPATLWFRAWSGSDIVELEPGAYMADGKVTLRIAAEATPVLRRSEGRAELRVPIRFNNNSATLVEDIIW